MRWSRAEKTLGSVLVDLNTQQDFLGSEATLPVRSREAVVAQLRRLMTLIRSAQAPVISTMEAYRTTDPINGLPRHCIDGTFGQNKLSFTLMSPRVVVHADNSFDLPYNVMTRYRQVIFRKQDRDLFANPKADRLLTELEPIEYVIFGVGIERSIKAVALGLIARHKKVAVIADACACWNEADADLALRQLNAKGVRLTTIDELAESELIVRRRVRHRLRSLQRHHPASRPRRRVRAAQVDSIAG